MSSPQQPGTTGDDQIPPIPPAPGAEVPPAPPVPDAVPAAEPVAPAAEPVVAPAEPAPAAPAPAAPAPAAPAEPVNPYAPPATAVPSSAPAAPVNPYAAPAAPAAPAYTAAPAAPAYAAAPANPYAPGASAPAYAAPAAPAGPSRFNVLGLVSLIAGGVAFLFGVTIGWIPFVGFFFVFLALVGVVLGIVGLVVKNKAKGLAIAGTIVSGVALLLTAAISIIMLLVVTTFANTVDDFDYDPDSPSITDPDGTTSDSDSDDGGLGSQSNPASAGDTITFTDLEGVDEWQVVVGTANLDATADILAAYEYNTEPEAGNQYVVVPITLSYVGTETGAPYNIYAQFLGTDSLLYDITYANYPNTLYEAADLAPGGSQDVNLIFEVASSAVDGGLLSVSSIWTDPIYVALG